MKKTKTKVANRKTIVMPQGKYTPLITATTDLTVAILDNIADDIKQYGLTINSAAVNNGVDENAIWRLLNVHCSSPENKALKTYAENAFKVASADFEKKLTKILLNKDEYNSTHLKMIERFLEIISPRFSRQIKVQLKYDLALLLDVVQKHTTPEVYATILEDLKHTDAVAILETYDAKFLNE